MTEGNSSQFSDDRDQKKSQKVLAELENIDDECDQNNIVFVKIDNDEEAKEYGIDVIPSLVLFEKKIPHLYEGKVIPYLWLLTNGSTQIPSTLQILYNFTVTITSNFLQEI